MVTPLFVYFWIVIVLMGFFLYFIPTIVSSYRKTNNLWLVFLINFFFGWSFIGWIVAFVLALTGETRQLKKCPYCLSYINESSRKCAYCGEWVEEKDNGLIPYEKNLPDEKK